MSNQFAVGLLLDSGRRRNARLALASAVVLAIFFWFIFQDGLVAMVQAWSAPEYSHGYLIPVVVVALVWRQRHNLGESGGGGAWAGALLVLLGLAMFTMGELGTIYTVIQYAFLVTLLGTVLAFVGWQRMRYLWVPVLYLAFMVPLPQFLYNGLSSDLQLISSRLGVSVIRLFGISVYLDGNVIDLGTYKLQVVEACSGLRYLFPLMSFGFLCAILYKGPTWQKGLIFLSTIPITILMNSFRIGVIGVLVEYYGIAMAEGFLHMFEGWFIFMACVLILFGEVWLLNKLPGGAASVFDRFAFDSPRPSNGAAGKAGLALPWPYVATISLAVVAAGASFFLSSRPEASLARQELVTFPMRIGEWRGQDRPLDRAIVETLKVSDYILSDFQRKTDPTSVNFYVAYYESQRKGQAVHSPQSCIPGDGWQIESFDQRLIENVLANGRALQVNRAIIAKGELKQLVYYWFPQRDRFLTNEYWVKWYIFWDALTRNRTDGALVRLVTPVIGPDGFDAAEERLASFAGALFPRLAPYFPS